MMHDPSPPSVAEVRAARERLGDSIRRTPLLELATPSARRIFGDDANLLLKLEVFQHAGSFKTRGAMTVALNQPAASIRQGLTTASSGNHAIAVAWVARTLGTSAKVVMQSSANRFRRRRFAELGGEALIAEDGAAAFELARSIERREGRVFIHPYEGKWTTLGAATVAPELHEQAGRLDAVVVAIGGGGLCSGLGPVIKQLQPDCKVYAVEPRGAATMYRSFASGRPEIETSFDTIADALAPPRIEPYSMALCRRSVDELVLVSDQEIRNAMGLLFDEAKLAVEPAGAAATAGACGPLRSRLRGRRFAVMVCGSNIDRQTFAQQLTDAR